MVSRRPLWKFKVTAMTVLLLGLSLTMACQEQPTEQARVKRKATRAVAGKNHKDSPKAADKTGAQTGSGTPSIADRRKRKPTVIGGCSERCQDPSKAMIHMLTALERGDHEELASYFDWSLLMVDHRQAGERWAEMWADPSQRPARRQDIAVWLRSWSSWRRNVVAPEGLMQSRLSGLDVKKIAGRSDVVACHFRPPLLKKPRGESTWRFEITRRGHEWLISRIDHHPGRGLKRPPPLGSTKAGLL